jgi:capsid protein
MSYALAKLKVEQLFALAFYRSAEESAGDLDDSAAVDENGEERDRAGYKVDFSKGPALLDLDPGDRAEFLQGNSPSANTQAFLLNVIMVALKSLDIPYSFYDEKHTNFFGSRAAWLHYERGCKPKRERVRRFLDHWTRWRTQIAMRSGLRIPAALSLVKPWWEWVPEGMPWWDPSKEIDGDVKAIKSGLSTPQRVVRERGGGDFFRNCDDTAIAIQYARARGLTLDFDAEGQAKLKPATPAPDAKPEQSEEDKPTDEAQDDQ